MGEFLKQLTEAKDKAEWVVSSNDPKFDKDSLAKGISLLAVYNQISDSRVELIYALNDVKNIIQSLEIAYNIEHTNDLLLAELEVEAKLLCFQHRKLYERM